MFEAIDGMDVPGFLEFLTEDAEFRFGSAPPVRGRTAIGAAVDGFFASIGGCTHRVRARWDGERSEVCEGEVRYRRKDGGEVTLPFVDVFEFEGMLISRYRIYIDIAPLYQA